ncbi:uroporphyrinogen-III synthase [Peribacillus alkalitolerans]|uniref:uroporphyrinogen-III synthase n=1 Tax=Peribacillus alkalitolerans TaxID=1550385 RepID=UPI0013D73912|nr:uroporphyrinogen-III synthase [Peribacillus alkalitolerans]
MDEHGFLHHKHVLITRGSNQSSEMSSMIKQHGGIPYVIPLLSFQKSESNQDKISAVLQRLPNFDWLVLTSKNGVDFLFEWLDCLNIQPKLPKIAVIGAKTLFYLQTKGHEADFVPTSYVAEVFVEEFITILQSNEQVLIAKGNLARDVIATGIRESGYLCEEIIIYDNVIPEGSEKALKDCLSENKIDIITFTSSSSVDHFMKIVKRYQLQEYILDSAIACIGPIAKARADKHGLIVEICPEVYTIDGMIEAMKNYYSNNI